ncbi:conserved membrane hypothetical protein [Candidatus Terasakiella magnetica]|nr:conserved membrane hypothetical protein [Candidatus Terasakiella magnetica]
MAANFRALGLIMTVASSFHAPGLFRRNAVLLILPVLFALMLAVMLRSSLPFWQVFNLDPDYYYLLNGLRLVEYLPPTDLGHPGTPIQMFIAVVLRLMHAGEPTGAIVEAVLDDPERHLLVATLLIYPLVALALFALGRAFLTATGRLAPALLAQSAPFLSMIIPKFSLHPKPEPFLIIAACLLVAVALWVVRAGRLEDRHAGWLGLVLGFGIACKMQFLALGLVPLFILDRRRLFLVLPLATIAGFLIFVAPAIPSRDIFFDWWGRVLLHSGAYGTGQATIVDTARYPRAILGLFGSKILFTVVFLLSLFALGGYVRLRRRGLIAADRLAGLLAGMVAAQLFTVLLIAKQAAAHYMLPALMLTGPSLAVLWCLSAKVFPARGHRRAWIGIGAVLALITVPAAWKQNAELARWTRDAQGFDMGRFKACAKIDFDSVSSLPYALQRGDMNAQGRYSPKIALRMPQDHYTWFINRHAFWDEGFMQFNIPKDLAQVVASYPCAVFRGTQPWRAKSWAADRIPGFHMDDSCEAGEETIFTTGIKCDGTAP